MPSSTDVVLWSQFIYTLPFQYPCALVVSTHFMLCLWTRSQHMFTLERVWNDFFHLSLKWLWDCNWRMMFFFSFPFSPPSCMCFFSTFPTSHYLIGHFQVGFMRAKLISVSKFSESKRDGGRKEEEKKTWLNWLFWFPLQCQTLNNNIKSLIAFERLIFSNHCWMSSPLSWHFVWHNHKPKK